MESAYPGEVFESRRFLHEFSEVSEDTGIHPERFTSDEGDLWIQDECSWGYTQTVRQTMPVVLHMLRQNSFGVSTELAEDVLGMMGKNVGYFKAFDYPPVSTTLDIGGNLEVTPPTARYPYGRIYYGSIKSVNSPKYNYNNRRINRGFQEFFERQGMQDPINLCTDWLIVGHVDELVTFVPQKNNRMKMLISSPDRALDILGSMDASTPLNSKYRDAYAVSTVGELLALKYLGNVSITILNRDVDLKLFGLDHHHPDAGSVKKIFMDELGLSHADIIEVPVLYQNFKYADARGIFSVVAMTPSLVNLYCMERDVVVPAPFIDKFRLDFENAIEPANMKVHWLDDWTLYHLGLGEIHCGTNARRGYFQTEWWKK